MFSLSLVALALGTADVSSQFDYAQGHRRALREHKDLVVYFRGDDRLDDVIWHPSVRERSADYVFVQVPADYQFQGGRHDG